MVIAIKFRLHALLNTTPRRVEQYASLFHVLLDHTQVMVVCLVLDKKCDYYL